MKMTSSGKYKILFFALLVLCASVRMQAQVITTIANIELGCGYSGDGSAAIYAKFNEPKGIAIDRFGNLYIADPLNNRVRIIDAYGIVRTFAGNGKAGYSGDGGKATSAELHSPYYVAIDAEGNVYISDTYNCRVRKVSSNGIITTVAGTGVSGGSGVNGPATKAEITYPYGLCFDEAGNLYIADGLWVKKVTTQGIISNVVGSGQTTYGGDGGPATAASCGSNVAVTFDSKGNLYVADARYNAIRKVDGNGIITKFAGAKITNINDTASGDGGQAIDARILEPSDLKFDSYGNLFVVDQGDGRIRKIDSAGVITTLAGNGTAKHNGDGSSANKAGVFLPYGMVIDEDENIYFTETSQYSNELSNDIRVVYGIEFNNSSSEVVVYPNPSFDGVVRLLFASSYVENVLIVITNMAGQKVYENTFPTNLPIEVRLEPTGIYALSGRSKHTKWHSEISIVR